MVVRVGLLTRTSGTWLMLITILFTVAEKTFIQMRRAASSHPEIHFIAISHSDQASTDRWLKAVGGAGNIGVIVDPSRSLYARWGLGVADWWHVLSWEVFWNLFKLAQNEGIKNRPTESGSRWQIGGFFVVDGRGTVRYGGKSERSDGIPDFEAAVEVLR